MGYYTKYDVKIARLNNSNEGLKIIEELYLRHNIGYVNTNDIQLDQFETKWYDWKEDCIRASKLYPHAIIEIKGAGEESGDLWKARVRNGKVELVEARIVFDDFKEIV